MYRLQATNTTVYDMHPWQDHKAYQSCHAPIENLEDFTTDNKEKLCDERLMLLKYRAFVCQLQM